MSAFLCFLDFVGKKIFSGKIMEKNLLAFHEPFSYNCGRLIDNGAVAHLARAPRLHRGGRGFDSLQLHH